MATIAGLTIGELKQLGRKTPTSTVVLVVPGRLGEVQVTVPPTGAGQVKKAPPVTRVMTSCALTVKVRVTGPEAVELTLAGRIV